MSLNGLGFQMKDDVKTDPKELSGMVLKNIFQKKTWFGNLGIFGNLDNGPSLTHYHIASM